MTCKSFNIGFVVVTGDDKTSLLGSTDGIGQEKPECIGTYSDQRITYTKSQD